MKVYMIGNHPTLGTVITVSVPNTSENYQIKVNDIVASQNGQWKIKKIQHWFDNCFGTPEEHKVNLLIEPINCSDFPKENENLEWIRVVK